MSNLEDPNGDAVSASREINRSTRGSDDPRYLAALAACETAQAALDATHLFDDDDPERLTACAAAYERRGQAWDQLAEALGRGVPPVFVAALFMAAMSDADSARNYRRWAAERGSGDDQ